MTFRPISEYGIIGNDNRCALVDRHGSIDWCCFPTLVSPSVFARILDDKRGGHFAIHPTDTYEVERQYLDRTVILQTVFETRTGRAVLTDFMPVTETNRRERSQQAIYRRLRCVQGTLMVELDFEPRLDYARAETTIEYAERGIVASSDDEQLYLQIHGSFNIQTNADRAVGTTLVEAGDVIWIGLQYEHFTPMPPTTSRRMLNETTQYWQTWTEPLQSKAQTIAGDRPWKEELIRSALTLKLLINENTGAIYAAATTSLPEEYGGDHNWDYRYNWIRDAKFTVQSLYNLGEVQEAHNYFEWFRDISHEDPADIQPVYGVHGETDLTEELLEHFIGHRHSTPVRIGNAAAAQRQLDTYGAIVQGLYEMLRHDEQLKDEDWESITAIVNHVCEVWDEKGNGIWEYRDKPRHYVHSKLMCWVALDRSIKLAEEHGRESSIDRWRKTRSAVREVIEECGYSEDIGCFVQYFGAKKALDATCLLIPIFDFLPTEDTRVQATIDTVIERMTSEQGLVYRTRDSNAAPDEPTAFLFCTIWLVDVLVLADRGEEVEELFGTVLEYMSPLGLLAERVDPRTGELKGNFPQAFSHIGLINSAIYLASLRTDSELEHDPQRIDGILRRLFRS